MKVYFDIYLNDDFFMHVFSLDEINSIVGAYELLGYRVKVNAVIRDKFSTACVNIYSTKEKAGSSEIFNELDSAFI